MELPLIDGGESMPVSTGTTDVFLGVAQHDADALEGLFQARVHNLEASGLDPKTYALVNIAALIAADAAPASYVFQVAFALESGVTPEEILGLLVALNPTVGNVRIVSAAAEIAFALGIDLEAEQE
jgi:alkylhydroperoxidase/carboxymuconolactone decarboxylase family protein YurZ